MVAGDAVNTASRVQSVADARPGLGRRDDPAADLLGDHLRRRGQPPGSRARPTRCRSGRSVRWWPPSAVPSVPTVSRPRWSAATASCGWSRSSSTPPRTRGGRSLVVIDGDPGVGKSRLAWEFEKYVDGLPGSRALAHAAAASPTARAWRSSRWPRRSADGSQPSADDADDDVRPSRARQLLERGLESFVPDDGRACLAAARGWARCSASAPSARYAREDLFSAWTTFLERVGGGEEPGGAGDRRRPERRRGPAAVRRAPARRRRRSRASSCSLTRPGLLEEHPALATEPARDRRAPRGAVHGRHGRPCSAGSWPGCRTRSATRLVERAEGVPLFAVETVRSLIDRDLVVPRGGQYVLADGMRPRPRRRSAHPRRCRRWSAARLDTLTARAAAGRRPRQRRSASRSRVEDDRRAVPRRHRRRPRCCGSLVRLQILSQETSRLSAGVRPVQLRAVRGPSGRLRRCCPGATARRLHLAVLELLLAETRPGGGPGTDHRPALPRRPVRPAVRPRRREHCVARPSPSSSEPRPGAVRSGSPAEAAGISARRACARRRRRDPGTSRGRSRRGR